MTKPPPTEREFAVEVVRRLREAGHAALWAGGCVRDELLGLTPKDYDVATSALPDQVRRLFRRTVGVGEAFLVVEVLGPRPLTPAPLPRGERGGGEGGPPLRVQVATFRSDLEYVDGRRPEGVVVSTAREDALRRDFTINGMFFDPLEDRVIDYVGGRDDLQNRVLRAIGDPEKRIGEDKLRMLRAARMAARFELTIDPATAAAIRAMAPGITVVSAERIADEFRKMLVDRRRARAMRLFMDLGLAAPVMPELLPMVGLPQGPPRADGPALPPPGRPAPSPPAPLPRGERGEESSPLSPRGRGAGGEGAAPDLWEHVLRVLDLLGAGPSFPLAFAALLHDVGKPRTVGRTPERYTFHGHEHVGRRMAADICLRLKTSNEERERVEWLVEKHQVLSDVRQMRTSKVKVLLAHPGVRELLALHRADALASGRSDDHVVYCERLLEEWSEADLNPPPVVTGHDLQKMGLEPGPVYKRLLDAVREAQLDGTIKTPAEARALVERLLSP